MLYQFQMIEIDDKGELLTKLHDKRDDFSFRIVIYGNIPSVPAYEVFISHLIHYARAIAVTTQTFCIR